MLSARSKSITILTALLVLLALISLTSTLTSRTGFTRIRQPGVAAGNFQGGNNNNNNGTDPQGGTTNNGGNAGGGGNFQGRGGNNAFGSIFRLLGPSFIYISLGITVLGILLALLSAYGVWKQKRWGLNLGMVIALLFLIGALPALFSLGGRNINWLRTSLNILSLVASVPVLVLGILPSVRDEVK
jgi:ABC-type glycerol-3-phosphate transport system permease component